MANPTTNYGWVMPAATDLVTDLPADFNVFGQGVDTSMQYLLGGTTGQVLAKTSGTNMAFTWTTPQVGDITGVTAGTGISGGGTSGDVTVTNSMATAITTNGDLIYGTGSGTFTRRGIGSTSQVLTVAGGIPTWATPATQNQILQIVQGTTATSTSNSTSTYADTTLTATITPASVNSKILILVSQVGIRKTLAALAVMDLQLVRGSTALVKFADYAGSNGSTAENYGWTATANWYDSPATTSATTYKTQFRSQNNVAAVAVQSNTLGSSTIILMEIAGL